jgi:hypothetical protein
LPAINAGSTANGTPHLPGDFGGDVVRLRDEGIDRLAQDLTARRERRAAPSELRGAGGVERPVDAGGGLEGAFDVDPSIDGADGFQGVGHR